VSAPLRCRAILFDLDGVLVDSRAVVERTWHRWAARRGVKDPHLVEKAHGRRSIETVKDVAPHLHAAEEVRWLAAAELDDVEGLRALPGAYAILAALNEREWAVVTSGGSELARRRLGITGLPTPNVLIAAEDVEAGKPAPDGYLLAAERLGLVAFDCVAIEDTPAGILAGRQANAKVLALCTTFPKLALVGADLVANSLADIKLERVGSQLFIHDTQSVA
jgi:mannitol-1-/sugar-/sorbitol-6-phosphatase